jgi:hypothetical protein
LQRINLRWRNDAMGHQLPRRLLVCAAVMAPITDTKADDWGGCRDRGELHQAAERAAADIEGHSEAAEFGQPGRLKDDTG